MQRVYLSLVYFALLACSLSAADGKPNIIMIYADDLGWGDVGFNGRTEWATPNLDKLASQGTVFKRWYTGGVVCAPSRAVLMTGKYTIHNGVSGNNADVPAEETTVAEALKKGGYSTALFGKWHHGRPRPGSKTYIHPLDHGFDEFFGYTSATAAHQHFPKTLFDGREEKPVAAYANILFTDKSLDFLTRKKESPFFLYLAYTIPHFGIQAPEEDIAAMNGKFKEKDPAKPNNATYAAMIQRLDKEIGRVVARLDELGLSDKTLLVFSSDHGATFEVGNRGTAAFHDSNRPFRGQKRTLWEGGIRVPSLVRWPGKVPAGQVSQELIHMMDVMPTFLAAASVEVDPAWKIDGANMLEVWTGKQKAPARTLFFEWRSEGFNQLAAMRGDLKLVLNNNANPELFNVETDPGERRTVFFEHTEKAKEMQGELLKWLATETESSREGREAPARPK